VISIVLPVYRNAETLAELNRRLLRALEPEGTALELIFVNDGCPAGSGEVLSGLASADPRVRVLTNGRNQGQRLTVWRGLGSARGDLIVTMDADLQDRPEDIPLLVREIRDRQFDAVFAARRGEHQDRSREITSRIFKRLRSALTGVPVDAGTFLAMTREARDRILRFETASPCLPVLLAAARLRLGSVAVTRDPRPAGESAYSHWMRIRLAWQDLRSAWKIRAR
jgi:glycosyltransferase involved in cell wall biosynthesis